ncbi:ubiquitin-like modifier 1 [Rhizodiscina lignyota]|uniref:Ubiquitin-related modifier 1 n=1 Tax=Rhizodiscina lignyota TaxID=1504668 RepID=A0A9P4IK62_9PEZI|nr:ubiquitin-like modifier 1 [Rhizodiscina lignyota]
MAEAEKSEAQDVITLKVEFTGGLEMLFSNIKEHKLSLPAKDEQDKATTVNYLVDYLCKKVMKDRRKELFVQDGTVRPGILVLINDADWELEGEGSYELQPEDNILFVSTLHGG